MIVTALVYQLESNYGTYDGISFDTGDFVNVLYDTDTTLLYIEVLDSDGTLKGYPPSGPSLSNPNELKSTQPYYRFCDSTTLKYINPLPFTWPYAELLSDANNFECAVDGPVCDLVFSSVTTTTPASDTETNDGTLTVTATSSNTIKYSLVQNFEYSTGQATGAFTNLFSGVYTVYAKDDIGCQAQIQVYVPLTTEYEPYYTLEFDSERQRAHWLVDIEKRSFAGTTTEVCGGGDPLVLTWIGKQSEKYEPIMTLEIGLQLMSETNMQFAELFAGDEREFKVNVYRDSVLHAVGYIIPGLHSEPYVQPPYPINITAICGLGLLKDIDFLNTVQQRYEGNLSQIFIVSQILKKTGLELNINCAINLYETTMDQTASDDPLEQAYVNVKAYYTSDEENPNCEYVLKEILKPYGARIQQAYGEWWITRLGELNDSFDYRTFDSDGVYVSNSTFNPSISFSTGSDTSRIVVQDQSALLTILPKYGTMSVINKHVIKDSIINGTFEESELQTYQDGSRFFKDWQVENISGGVSYGLEEVVNGDSKGAFYMDFTFAGSQSANVLKTKIYDYQYKTGDYFEFQFEYLCRPIFNLPWVRLGYQIITDVGNATDKYFKQEGVSSLYTAWSDSAYINYIYPDKYNEFQNFKILIPVQAGIGTTDSTIQFKFYLEPLRYDYNSISALKAVSTGTLPIGTRYTVADGANIRFYTLEDNDEDESRPDIVEPNSGTGRWIQNKAFLFDGQSWLLDNVLIDNVIFRFLPDGFKPVEETSFDYINSDFIKINYEQTCLHGDLDQTVSNGAQIYNDYLMLSDGTPTELWARSGVSEEFSILALLSREYGAQMSEAVYQITGQVQSDVMITPINGMTDTFDSNKKYLFTQITTNAYLNNSDIECIEIKGITSPGDFSSEFSTEFDVFD